MAERLVVYPEFVEDRHQTKIWMSKRSKTKEFARLDAREQVMLLDKLDYCAEGWFRHYEGKGKPIVSEGSGVYRFGIKRSLFRWWGFYNGPDKSEFIIVDSTMKKGQKRGKSGNDMAKRVAEVRNNGLWRKATTDEQDHER